MGDASVGFDMKRMLLIVALVTPGTAACGSKDSDSAGSSACAEGRFELDGSIEGTASQLNLPLGGFGYDTQKAGVGDFSFGTSGKLHVEYSEALATGQPRSVTGTLKLPTEAPRRSGETLTLGAGSSFTLLPDDGLRVGGTFELTSFEVGTTPLDGELSACFAYRFDQN